MSQSLRVNKLAFNLQATYRNTNGIITTNSIFDHLWPFNITNGTAANQFNFAWHSELTINASSSTTLDLTALTDDFGIVQTLLKLKLLAVKVISSSDAAAQLKVGASGTGAFFAIFGTIADSIVLNVGAINVLVAPDATAYAVDGTHKLVKFANLSALQPVVVDVVIAGVK